MIQGGGAAAQELKDQVNCNISEIAREGDLIKGRQIVKVLLLSFKTFDNSEIVYGFDHLAKLERGTDLYFCFVEVDQHS